MPARLGPGGWPCHPIFHGGPLRLVGDVAGGSAMCRGGQGGLGTPYYYLLPATTYFLLLLLPITYKKKHIPKEEDEEEEE